MGGLLSNSTHISRAIGVGADDVGPAMPITHKTAAALLLVFLALLLGAALILDRAVRPRFDNLEAAAHARDLARVEAHLAEKGEGVRARVADYAHWDDTYAYVAGQNPTYTDDLTDGWLEDYDIDFVAFANDAGQLLWSRRRLPNGRVITDAASAAALIRHVRDAGLAEEPALGVVSLPGSGLVMLAASPATRNDGGGVPRGLVLIGQRLDEQTLGQQTQLHVELQTPGSAAFAQSPDPSQTGAPLSWREGDQLFGLIGLYDLRGRQSGALVTTQPREIAALGQQTVTVALVLFAIMAALVIAVLWLSLRAELIRRLQQLERHINAQGGELQPMAEESGRRDEIARLTTAYNALVTRLRETSAREEAAQLQSEAEAAANRMKSDFLANISHELRTPLNAVIGYAELVKEELNDKGFSSTDEDLQRIVTAARQLLDLVNQILDLSRIEAGRLAIKPETFIVREMLQSVAAAAREADTACVQIEAADELGVAYSDQLRLRQCLVNVLTAGRDPDAATASVVRASRETEPDGDRLRFQILCPGAQIDNSEIANLFEPFARRDGADGAGLGLTMTRRLIALLGGDIEVAAAPEGAMFVLTVPAVAEDAHLQRTRAA